MTIALWIVNGLLALAFLFAGVTKLARPKEALTTAGMAWVEDFSSPAVKGIGTAEVLAALGLILPFATGIAVVLTPIAAIGLVLLMAGAVITHLRRKEAFIPPLVLGLLAAASAVLGFLVLT